MNIKPRLMENTIYSRDMPKKKHFRGKWKNDFLKLNNAYHSIHIILGIFLFFKNIWQVGQPPKTLNARHGISGSAVRAERLQNSGGSADRSSKRIVASLPNGSWYEIKVPRNRQNLKNLAVPILDSMNDKGFGKKISPALVSVLMQVPNRYNWIIFTSRLNDTGVLVERSFQVVRLFKL